MLISASYKTDIPAFYGQWFLNRLRAGYCKTTNPYSGKAMTVSLRPEDVEGFVFWTRNIDPFMPALEEVRARGSPFVVQYTITGYGRELERSVPAPATTTAHAHRLADLYGPWACVWRYDTILFSELTPPDFHRRNFAALCCRLEGAVDEVVVSFAHMYRKTTRGLAAAGVTWDDPDDQHKRALAVELGQIAAEHGMRLTVCSQRPYVVAGAGEARCIDADRLGRVAGQRLEVPVKGNRPDCACHQSRDIGAYDTCPHGCVYCYAVSDQRTAAARLRRHDPEGEFLVPSHSRELE